MWLICPRRRVLDRRLHPGQLGHLERHRGHRLRRCRVAEVEGAGVLAVDQQPQRPHRVSYVEPRAAGMAVDGEALAAHRRVDEGRQRAAPVAAQLPGAVEHVHPDDGQVVGGQVEAQDLLAPALRQPVDRGRHVERRVLVDRLGAVVAVDLRGGGVEHRDARAWRRTAASSVVEAVLSATARCGSSRQSRRP